MQNFDKKAFIAVCASGNYSQVIAYLESLDDGQEMLEKFKDIFEKGAYVLGPEDESISDALRTYEDYLKWILTKRPPVFFSLMRFIIKCGYKRGAKRYFKRKGYYSRFGFTAPYYDLYLWRNQTDETISIEIPEGTVEVNICTIDGIITRGWLDYFSLGVTGSGGWATKKKICYFKEFYDPDSDKFKNSLLKHEAQHVFDLRKYPRIKSPALEYRAKLVELIYNTEMDIFFNFLLTMSDDKKNPHGWAAGQIIKNLSLKIFGRNLETNRDLWVAESKKIPEASLELLKEHSKKMASSKGRKCVI